METATEWLFNKLLKAEPNILEWNKYLEQAKEKEKEQIINAFEVGYKSCDLDEAFEINIKLASGELHYNQTYNQNK